MIGMVLTLIAMLVAFYFFLQSLPGLSPYPMASVNSPPDGGFPTHQHTAADPDGVFNGFNHLAEPVGQSQGGGGDGYHHLQQDSSYTQVVPWLLFKYIHVVMTPG